MLRKVNVKVLCWLSVSALLGIVLAMGLHYYGLRATNAAYSVNFLNLIPVVTFAMAVVLRLEKLAAGTWAGRMKMAGTAISVGGTMLASLYKGPLLRPWPTHLLHHHAAAAVPAHRNMALGTVYLCGSCVAYALWFIVQARVGRVFPSKYLATMLACVSGTVQALAIGAAVSRRAAAWRLAWDLQLVAVVYSGALNTGATFCLISWAIARRGPIYPSMFNSLALVGTMVMDSLLLGTDVSVGSLLGAMLIVVGLYAFLWGREERCIIIIIIISCCCCNRRRPPPQFPLLLLILLMLTTTPMPPTNASSSSSYLLAGRRSMHLYIYLYIDISVRILVGNYISTVRRTVVSSKASTVICNCINTIDVINYAIVLFVASSPLY